MHCERLIPVFASLALAGVLSACGSGISLDEPIEGPVWRLVQLAGVASSLAPDAGAQGPRISFAPGSSQFSGSGGCNTLSGRYTRSGSQLRVNQLGLTRMACLEPGRDALETQFIQALQKVASYRLQSPSRLALLDATGSTLAVFEADVPAASASPALRR